MAASEDNDLIGYDPLAWMEGNADKNEQTIDNGSSDSDEAQHLIDDEIGMTGADDYSDDLMADSDLNITLEDGIVIAEIELENDTVCIDAGAVAVDSMSEETEGSQIDLDSTLTIQNVVKLHEKLKNLLDLHDQIEINASDVSSIDTATLQLLVSLKKDADKLQKKVTIIYPSPRFVESAQLLGLLDVLDVDGM